MSNYQEKQIRETIFGIIIFIVISIACSQQPWLLTAIPLLVVFYEFTKK